MKLKLAEENEYEVKIGTGNILLLNIMEEMSG